MRLKQDTWWLLLYGLTVVGCASIQAPTLSGRSSARPQQVGGVRVADVTDAERMLVRRVHIDAPREEVFAYLTDFEAMPDWLPGLNEVTVDNGDSSNGPERVGVGTRRSCDATGATVVERVVHFAEPREFAYTITSKSGPAMPLTKGTGVVTLEPTRDGGTDLHYHVFYETNPWHPMSPVFPVALGKQLGNGLENVAEHFEHQRLARGALDVAAF